MKRFAIAFAGMFLAVGLAWIAAAVLRRGSRSPPRKPCGCARHRDRRHGAPDSRNRAGEMTFPGATYTPLDDFVRYRFPVFGGGQAEGIARVSREAWAWMDERGPIDVRYAEGDPQASTVARQLPSVRRALVAVALALATAWTAAAWAQAPACGIARGDAPRLLAQINPRANPEPSPQAAKLHLTPADAFDAAAAGSLMKGEMAAAASAGLQALLLEWTPRRAANAGVALMYLGKPDEAAKFLACARSLDPNLVYAIEGEALLAHRRKDCAAARRLIDEVVARMPRDANARYNAGIIHYKCGDRARAETELRAAVDMAGIDPVITRALAVVAPGAAPKTRTPKEVRKKIDELYRFMDEAVAAAERDRDLLKKVVIALGRPADGAQVVDRYIEQLKQGNEVRRNNIARLEAMSQQQAAQYPQLAAPAWSGLLGACVRAYFQTLDDLFHARAPGMGIHQYILAATAMGLEPVGLVHRLSGQGNVVILDEMKAYFDVVNANTHLPNVGTNCPPIREAYATLVDRTKANSDALKDGFPGAVADYANLWLGYAADAAAYAKGAVAIARFGDQAQAQAYAGQIRAAYVSMVHDAILAEVVRFLKNQQRYTATNVQGMPPAVAGARIRECDKREPEAASLADAVERLMQAFEQAGSYDGGLVTPDCTIEMGSVKVSCKPLAFEGVKATWSGPVKVSVTAEGDRWGVDASAGSFSGSSRGGGRMNVSSTSADASYYGVKGDVAMSSWIERGANGEANAYVQAKGSLGVGVDAEGLGSVSCEFFTASAKLNLRAFAEALTR